MAKVISSIGAELYLDTLDSSNRIDGLKDFSSPSWTRSTIDSTSHSTPSGFKSYLVGRWESGTISFSLNFDPQDVVHRRLQAQLGTGGAADDPNTYILRFPSAEAKGKWATIEFKGFLTTFTTQHPIEDVLMAECEIIATEAPTINNDDPTIP